MKLKNISLFAFLIFSINGYAEGQSGLGTFILISYMICIGIYTFVGGIFIKLFFKMIKLCFKNQTHWSIFIAFVASLLAAAIFDNNFLFIFWGSN
ncbi:hypothetical protein ACNQGB_00980 [Flavobacterium sp. XS1P32]|uniref:hypothetical protein n=1 Tax=Flavobacterium sp. XS1P32 TaxID=3401726 RepID=UPI003AAC3041